MKNEIRQQLSEIKTAWSNITVVPEDLTPWGLPGLTKSILSASLGGLVEIADQLEKISGFEPPTLSKYVALQNINNLRAYVVSHIPGNPQPHIPEFLNIIERIFVILTAWLESADKNGKHVVSNLARTLAASIASMQNAEQLYKQLAESSKEVLSIAERTKAESEAVKKQREAIEVELKAAAESMEKINIHRTESTTSASGIKELVGDLQSLKIELDANKSTQNSLFAKFEAYRVQINELIGAASQVGMAASFSKMKLAHERNLWVWLVAFVAAVLALAIAGVSYVGPAIASKDWIEMIIKLPLTFPLIWLAWFFAKQYGYTVRLREDYAFKFASAMSFEAHKREAREIDAELLKKLLEISIKNFADNPLRIFGNDNHASPLHESLDSILKNVSLIDKLRDAYQKIVKSPG